MRANRGAAGIDRITIEQVERHGVSRVLDQLEADLKNGSYQAQPSRRVFIPKPGGAEGRPLSIPTVGDRIVQTAAKIVTEPIFEADFMPCSFGFRPEKAAHDALQVLLDETWRGARWVVETDIASCFEEIPHERLMAAVEERIVDRKLLRLLRAMLGAGVMHEGAVRHGDAGTPQGGVISPPLANVYLHRLDRRWGDEGWGTMVRYADDLVVLKRFAEASGAPGCSIPRACMAACCTSGSTPARNSSGSAPPVRPAATESSRASRPRLAATPGMKLAMNTPGTWSGSGREGGGDPVAWIEDEALLSHRR